MSEIDEADKPLADALIRLINAVVRATKSEGVNKGDNEGEGRALRMVLKQIGYTQAHLRKRVEAYIQEHTC